MKKCSYCGCDDSFEKTTIIRKTVGIPPVSFTDEVFEVKCKKCGNLLYGRVTPIHKF